MSTTIPTQAQVKVRAIRRVVDSLDMPTIIEKAKVPLIWGLGLCLHTAVVYICALYFSPWLVGRWFAWFAPLLHASSKVPPGDWYLQHLELVSIVPGVIAGYLNSRRRDSPATWAWAVPTLVLAYQMLRFRGSSSVLSPESAFAYFLNIQHSMPTLVSPTASDPIRVLAQMTITAPFYAGVAYSLGALCSKLSLVHALFRSRAPAQSDSTNS